MNGNDNKIKVGDTVRLKSGVICCGLNHMTQYLIERVRCKSVVLEGKDGAYDESIFIKVKSNPELIGEILTPLQAAEAMLKNDDLQVYDSCCEQWYSLPYCHKTITIEYLKNTKIRLKPKTITINGVEVPSPATKGQIKDYFYVLDISFETIHKVDKMYISNNKNFWATEEDAQKALDAILIPFNELNRGEQQ